MVQLQVLTGRRAGERIGIRRFPCEVGRSAPVPVRFEDGGVWERHGRFRLDPEQGVLFEVEPQAGALLNGEPAGEAARIRPGDILELGSVKMIFWLSEARQVSHRAREMATWICLGILCLGQVALAYRLLQ